MSVSHHFKTTDAEVSRVRGGDVAELLEVAATYADGDCKWYIEGGAVVFERNLGTRFTG